MRFNCDRKGKVLKDMAFSKRLLLPVLVIAILNVSCYGGQSTKPVEYAPGPPLKIYCSFLPIYQFTANLVITRKNISLEMVVPYHYGNVPQGYALTDSDRQNLAKANLLIVNGMGADDQIAEAAGKANPNVKIVDTSKGIEPLNLKNGKGVNPYIWMSPKCVITQVQNIEKALYEVDPKAELEFKGKTEEYVKILKNMDIDLTEIGGGRSAESQGNEESAGEEGLRVIVEDDYFDYLARDYGFQIVDTVGEQDAADHAKLSKLVNEKRAQAVLLRLRGKSEKGRQPSKELPLCYLSLLFPGSTYPDGYELAMKSNIDAMKKATGAEITKAPGK